MQLLSAQRGLEEARAIVADPKGLPAVAIDPDARNERPVTLVAVADETRAVIIDAAATPGIGEVLRDAGPIAAWDAKRVHSGLLARNEAGPDRWACVKLTELLIAGGRDWSIELDAVAARVGVETPADLEAGLDAMADHARSLSRIVAAQIPELKRDNLTRVSKLEASAVGAIAAMERAGLRLDADCWRGLNDEAKREREALADELHGIFRPVAGGDLFGGSVVNLDNDHDLKKALVALGYDVPNVRRATIEMLAEPLGPTLSRYRELGKLVTAYGDTFLAHVGADGRLHPTFEQIGASTGRMACREPNLQAIVKNGPHRACFRCEGHRRLVVADYATCELRILAEMSGDPVFEAAFRNGDDLHATVASSVFQKPVSKNENPELRQRAKAINFGLVYGMGAPGLARQIHSSLEQAEELFARYFETFPRIGTFLEQSAREALDRGWAQTLTGRRLYLDRGRSRAERGAAQRVAKNMPIQGTSADITKIALARVHHRLQTFQNAHLVNAVHDEIAVECDAADAEAVKAAVAEEMRGAGAEVLQRVALEVDATVGTVWGK